MRLNMTYRDPETDNFIDLLESVDTTLTNYVHLHNKVFSPGAFVNVRRIVPIPFFFSPIPYPSIVASATTLLFDLILAREDLLSIEWPQELPPEFLISFGKYLDLLINTVAKFRDMCEKLGGKADWKKYRWREYKRDLKEYEASMDRYAEEGGILNELLEKRWGIK